MNTRVVDAGDVSAAIEILKGGGLVAFPTDTVYGLGALAFDNRAIESIYTAKNRPAEKGIPILFADADEMDKVAVNIPDMVYIFAARFWPGPLTCVVPGRPTLPPAVSTTSTVAIRIPDHIQARALLRAAGPLAVTSANISGGENPCTADEVFAQLNGRIPLILDGGRTPGGTPSTLVDCTGSQPVILRQGPIPLESLLIVLG